MSVVLGLDEVDATQVAAVGGKGANLGELRGVAGVVVPDGFCVTTAAYELVVPAAIDGLLEPLDAAGAGDRTAIGRHSAAIRTAIERVGVPDEVATAIAQALDALGPGTACAVRSSATAEDLPGASFAGQLDSYLGVVGLPAVLEHVRLCWASLFTERAVTYRLRHGFDHRAATTAVVVQRLVPADAAGVLFTADPITSNRTVSAVEAVRGLADGLVSGTVTPDTWSVRGDTIVQRTVRGVPVLSDAEVRDVVALGRLVEAHFGRPQDIEWCLAGGDLSVVQSRPITTVYPIPQAEGPGNRIHLSVGHQQMMTDAMKPLGLSIWQLTTQRAMAEAGGRLFVDSTAILATVAGRASLLEMIGRSDPLTRDAVQTVLDRGFLPAPSGSAPPPNPVLDGTSPPEIDTDVIDELVAGSEQFLDRLQDELATLSGPALFAHLQDAFEQDRKMLFDPRSIPLIMAGHEATWWLNDHLRDWLGEPNAADALSLSAPGNVTSQMGLDLLDVADVVRPHPAVVEYLQHPDPDDPLGGLAGLDGGAEAAAALGGYLQRYGMRCAGEIDITRPRWSERPADLLPTLLGNVRSCSAGESRRRFAAGEQQARAAEQDLLTRLRELPDGAEKADRTRVMIARLRATIGYREYPKYAKVARAFAYKRALLAEADRLVAADLLHDREDAFYLRFEELRDLAGGRLVAPDATALIARRRAGFAADEQLTPPRVLTSDGERVDGAYHRGDLPPGALAGLPVSSGTVEGRARVVLDMAGADLEPGDVLVTVCTDPSWTPLFVGISGLVTEVGGLMTHGAVIAREYGLPAVVGVRDATTLIADGQRIRLHGTGGYVELLPDAP